MRTNDVYIDEHGELCESPLKEKLTDRNEEIKEKLSEAYEILKKEKETCRALKSKEKVGGRFAIQLERVLSSYGLMTAQEVANINYEQIEANYNAFIDLIAYYNLSFEIVPNKQLFQNFLRINNRIYSNLENSQDDDIADLMLSINDRFISIAFMSSESGNADGKATLNRLTMHDAGHSLIKENEKRVIDKVGAEMTDLEFKQKLEQKGIKVLG